MKLSLGRMQENLRGDVVYFSSVSVNFIICRGHVTATVTFGDGILAVGASIGIAGGGGEGHWRKK